MKKKLVVVLLTAAMSMSLLAGCGGNSGSSDAKSDAKDRGYEGGQRSGGSRQGGKTN